MQNGFLGTRDFSHLKLGIRDMKAKSGRVSELKIWAEGGMLKKPLVITGLHEILSQDYRIEELTGDLASESLVAQVVS